jgi:hypothetical protein
VIRVLALSARTVSGDGNDGGVGDEREVFRWFFWHLADTKPLVPVTQDLADRIRALFADMINGQTIERHAIDWGVLFGGIDWNQLQGIEGLRIGKMLLWFLGCLGEALKVQGPVRISLIKALVTMLDFEDDDIYLELQNWGDNWWIESTPKGTEAIGFAVNLKCSKSPSFMDTQFEDLAGRE